MRILGQDDGNQSTADGDGTRVTKKKVGFENLAQTVAARWKATSEEERAPYKEKAAVSFCLFSFKD